MEKPPLPVDTIEKRAFKKRRGDFRQKMRELVVDEGFMRFLIADHAAIPIEYKNPAPLSSEARKLREANFKKMKRRLMRQFPDRWREKWKETKKSFRDMEKAERDSVLTLWGPQSRIWNPVGYPPPQLIGDPSGHFELRNPITGKRWVKPKPMNLRVLSFIWLTKSYFERLTKAKTGKPNPRWDLIAELLDVLPNSKRMTGTDVASWWGKVKKVFEIWNEDTFLESILAEYQEYKPELDMQ